MALHYCSNFWIWRSNFAQVFKIPGTLSRAGTGSVSIWSLISTDLYDVRAQSNCPHTCISTDHWPCLVYPGWRHWIVELPHASDFIMDHIHHCAHWDRAMLPMRNRGSKSPMDCWTSTSGIDLPLTLNMVTWICDDILNEENSKTWQRKLKYFWNSTQSKT